MKRITDTHSSGFDCTQYLGLVQTHPMSKRMAELMGFDYDDVVESSKEDGGSNSPYPAKLQEYLDARTEWLTKQSAGKIHS